MHIKNIHIRAQIKLLHNTTNKIMLQNKTYLITCSNSGNTYSSGFGLKRSAFCVYQYIIMYEDKGQIYVTAALMDFMPYAVKINVSMKPVDNENKIC
jgi:hypothetical protein